MVFCMWMQMYGVAAAKQQSSSRRGSDPIREALLIQKDCAMHVGTCVFLGTRREAAPLLLTCLALSYEWIPSCHHAENASVWHVHSSARPYATML